ncbi:MAG: hypothetical protein ACHP9Z_15255 [Streptosporangiales bacterium]
MSGRAAFGDFLAAAHQQLGTPAAFRTAIARGGDVTEIRHSLLRVVVAMSRHVQDTTATGPQPSPGGPALAGWDRAGLEAREALIRAAAALYGDTLGRRRPGVAAGSELARRIDAATVALICGRDLLQTHLAHGPSGGLRFRSEWGSILTTPRARWALLPEMGSLAHRLAPAGEQLGLSARARGSPRARQAVSDACHWLQIMDTSIRQAYRDEPALGADLELLRAVPVGACPPARRPDASGPVSGLPQAVIATAELARHTAWLSGGQPPWRPGMSVNSLRQTAAASTLTSYHCETLLRSLACGQRLAGEPGTALRAAAGAASRARIRWLGIARALDQVTTSSQQQPSPVAAAAGDLALWTGRLARADPAWTPASRPLRRAGQGEAPSREPGDVAGVLAAVHDACDAMTRIAAADRQQVRSLTGAGQILAAAGPGPATLDMPGPVAPARPDRIGALLTLYQYTAQASADATTAISAAATAARMPHRAGLPAIRTAQHPDPGVPEATGQFADAQSVYEPGRIERTLRGLGITGTHLLRRRAEDLDRAAEQLITQAAAEHEAQPSDPSSAGTHARAAKDADRQGRRAVQAEEAEAEH